MKVITKSRFWNIVFLINGSVLMLIVLIWDFSKNNEGIFLGIGAGLFGMSMANLLSIFYLNRNPEKSVLEEIEYYDERNQLIRYKAKAAVSDMIQWIIIGIAYITIFLGGELWITLGFIGLFLLKNFVELYLMSKYQNEI